MLASVSIFFGFWLSFTQVGNTVVGLSKSAGSTVVGLPKKVLATQWGGCLLD